MNINNVQNPGQAYDNEQYDPSNLTLVNQGTATRLSELTWSTGIFANKSVLDIGSNSGIHSLYAIKLGAKSVKNVSSSPTSASYFSSVVDHHKLPIQVDTMRLNELDPAAHESDIVVFIDRIHWQTTTNTSLDDMVYKLTSLTSETLYLEAPWNSDTDTDKPSITKNGSDQLQAYSIEQILKQLQKYFTSVQVIRFNTHSDENKIKSGIGTEHKNSNHGECCSTKTILIKASGRREDFESMRGLNNVNPLDTSLRRGNNSIQLMTSARGPVVLKKLPPESMLPLLDTDSANELFSILEKQNGPLLPAHKLGENYIYKNALNEHCMLSPFVGDLADHFEQHVNHSPVSDPLKLAVACRRSLIHMPQNIVQALRDKSIPITLKTRTELGIYFNHLIDKNGLSEFIDDVYSASAIGDRSIEDSVIHNDLQLGNMITDSSGNDWIIDLDILRSGTAYSDFICCAIYNNCSSDSVETLYRELVVINGRKMLLSDMYFAMNILLKWVYVLNKHHKVALAQLAKKTVNGIKTLHSIAMTEESDRRVA